VPANIIAILLGVWLGIFAAKHRGKAEDAIGMGVGLLLWSMPTFWIGLIIIVYWPGGLPTSGMTQPGMHYANNWYYIKDVLRHLVLPTLTLSLVSLGQYAIIMRNSLSIVMTEDYITTARAKGFNLATIFRKYAVPNAMLPLVTIIAVNLGLSVAGAIQAEIVFHWPGLGSLVYDSVIKQDYPMLQGAFLVISATVIFANFLAELIYVYLDPRIKNNES
jgi:peptide/nickel transport system permease protein